MAILIAGFQIGARLLTGLLNGFGYSPYGHGLLVLVGNAFYVGSMLFAIELSRSYLVVVFSKRSSTFAIVITALLFALINIPIAKYSTILGMEDLFQFLGGTFLPTFAESILASALAFLGGPLPAIAYRGSLLYFEWVSPLLPRMGWVHSAFIETMTPAIGLLAIWNIVDSRAVGEEEKKEQTGSTAVTWALVLALAVGLFWFNTGLFGIRPTLVSGSSMTPTYYAGDIVITRDVSADEIEVGDVVRFQRGGIYILHRVVEKHDGDSGSWFITKGDANNVLDSPVYASEIQGKVVLRIPKLGWVSIKLRKLIEWIL